MHHKPVKENECEVTVDGLRCLNTNNSDTEVSFSGEWHVRGACIT